MKYYFFILIFLFSCSFLIGQCPEYHRMIQEADELLEQEKYRLVLNKLEAARMHCTEKDNEVRKKILEVFDAIEKKKDEAEQQQVYAIAARDSSQIARLEAEYQRQLAIQAKDSAETARQLAEELRLQAQISQEEADKQKNVAVMALDSVERLAQKGLQLRYDLVGENSYETLVEMGENNFKRGNALEAIQSFSVAKFLNSKDSLVLDMLNYSKLMNKADSLFEKGLIQQSHAMYNSLDSIFDIDFISIRKNELEELMRPKYDLTTGKLPFSKSRFFQFTNSVFNTIPDPFESEELDQVTWIDISANYNLDFLPDIILNSKNLKYLEMYSCNLETFPMEVLNNSNLKYLDISGNKIRFLPQDITPLKNLKYLNISGNPIRKKDVLAFKNKIPFCKVKAYGCRRSYRRLFVNKSKVED